MLDHELIRRTVETNKQDMFKFLRDIVAIPSESCREEKVILRIKEEMEKVGFDRIEIDPMGNILGYIGHGEHLIAMDAHIDTVGQGDLAAWKYDPYEGYEDDEIIVGRGTSDQKGGMAAMVYAGKAIKELGLEEDYTLLVTGTVQEEDCDGLCWEYIIKEDGILPEFVVSTEPTSCQIYRGQRGRIEIKVSASGLSCHGSAPERGDNAIYKMAPILEELQELNDNLLDHPFLGKGTLAVSEIFSSSPSRCAVADGCAISIDRRLTFGESLESAIGEIENLPSVKQSNAKVELYHYDRPSYTGVVYPQDCYFPAWLLDEDHLVCETLKVTYSSLFQQRPVVDKWTFSTNGVAIMGLNGIPCIGFGPGEESEAHAPNEKTWKSHLVQCAAMYAAIPQVYLQLLKNED